MHAPRWSSLLFVSALILAGCPEDEKRPLGSTCTSDEACAEGQCLAGYCLDPSADDDLDTLSNALEAGLGTNPLDDDSDGDGILDGEEVGDAGTPTDTDNDGKADALESNVGDSDGDCIVDALDPNDGTPETDPAVLASFVCDTAGACGASGATVTASCTGTDVKTPTCDYTGVPGYESDEAACDGVDNDCDGTTDERHVAGGSVTFDGGPYAADAGKVLGAACGIGACADGVVVCASDKAALACSTAANAGPLTCDADMDCDGTPDEDEVADPIATELAGCTDFFQDTDNDQSGAGAAECLCAASGAYTVSNDADCAPDDGDVHPGAAAICGVDADCDESLVDVGEACDDGNEDTTDGCHQCTPMMRKLASVGEAPYQVFGARLEGGGFALAWDDGFDSTTESSLGRTIVVFDAAGVEIARTEGIGAGESSADYGVTFARLRNGDLVMGAWRYDDVGTSTYEVQRFTSSAAPKGDPIPVITGSSPQSVYSLRIAPLSQGSFALVWTEYSDGTRIVMRRVDGEDKIVTPDGDLYFPTSIGDPRVLGFEDDEIVVAWYEYDPETFESRLMARRIGDDGEPVADAWEIAAAGKRSFELVHGPGAARWSVFSMPEIPDSDVSAIEYLSLDFSDTVTDGPTTIQDADTDGCPYSVLGAFDAEGQAIGAFEDGECRSPVRAWLLPTGADEPVALKLTDEAVQPHTGGLVVIGGLDPVFVHVNYGETGDEPDRGIYINRFDSQGNPRYVPLAR